MKPVHEQESTPFTHEHELEQYYHHIEDQVIVPKQIFTMLFLEYGCLVFFFLSENLELLIFDTRLKAISMNRKGPLNP